MGWGLGRGKLSTAGFAHPGFQFMYLHVINIASIVSGTQLSKWTVVTA